MGASERLRELLEPMAFGDPEASYEENARRSFEATLTMRNALPLIADVVEAAEKLYAEAASAAPLWDEIDAALTALQEHLDEQ